MRASRGWHQAFIVLAVAALVWGLVRAAQSSAGGRPAPQSQTPAVFTPRHRSVLEAIEEFLDYRPTPKQPIAFTHKVHVANGMECVNCHAGVDTGPDAAIPSVKFCMTCHQVIATDRAEIKKLAAYQARGEEVPWQRVYGYYPSARVQFNHAPHIRAGVACATCHGDMSQRTVAVRSVNLNMGYCLNCHKQRKVSIDCITCHF